MDICGFAFVNVEYNNLTALKAYQTTIAIALEENGLNLLGHYASIVSENVKTFMDFLPYLLADAYFSKNLF